MSARKPYHHGNLRESLLETGIRLIAEVGPVGFTLREVARRAGVSHNAPYRHFRDRDDLMAAIGTQGFRELTQSMRRASADQPDSLAALKSAGIAYITFALRRPQHFTVMFDAPEAAGSNHPDLAAAGKEAFDTLLSLVTRCQEETRLPAGDSQAYALLAWTMVHGIAKLAITRRLPFKNRGEMLKFAGFVIDQSLPAIPAQT